MGGRGAGSGLRGRGGGGGLTSFPDTAKDGWSYHGSGRDQVNFFKNNSNYDVLISSMSNDEKDAFRAWASGRFMYGQQYQGWDNMTGAEQRRTQMYDKYLDQATLSAGVTLSRRSDAQLVLGAGNKTPSLSKLQAMEGQLITSKGSMSFGAASEGLTIGSSGKKVEYKLSIPGGTKGSGMWIGDKRINGWGPEQREFMTNRDVSFKVGKTTYNKSKDIYTVELEYMGRQAHDYGTSGKISGI